MDITITKKNIYEYAMSLTARAGKALNAYHDIALTEDNYPMLDVYLSSAITLAEGSLRRKLENSNSFDLKADEDSITITLREPMRLDGSVTNHIESGIRLFLAYHIAASWLLVTPAKEYSTPYLEGAMQHLNAVYNALNQKRPQPLGEESYSAREEDEQTASENQATGDYSAREEDEQTASENQATGHYSAREEDRNIQAKDHTSGTYSTRAADEQTGSESPVSGTYSMRAGDSEKGEAYATEKNYQSRLADNRPTSSRGEDYYQRRKQDNVIARAGMRITERELLVVRSDECSENTQYAGDMQRRILISNQ